MKDNIEDKELEEARKWLSKFVYNDEMAMQREETAGAQILIAYHRHRLETAGLDVKSMWEQLGKSQREAGEYPTGGTSVRSPKNFYRTGFLDCYNWVTETLLPSPPKETKETL